MKPTVLLDIDHTILDVERLRLIEDEIIEANYGEGSAEKFWQVYKEVMANKDIFNVKEVAMAFAEKIGSKNYASAVAAFMEADFGAFLFPGAKELIDYLAKNSNLIIFTHGHDLFQGQKIKKIGLAKIAKKVVITTSKVNDLPNLLAEFAAPYVVIDDNAQVISAAQNQKVPVITILVTVQDHHSAGTGIEADFVANDLFKVLKYLIKKFPTNQF